MIRPLFVVSVTLLSIVNCIPIHKRMTREEIRATFNSGHGSVPDYEVATVFHTFAKKSGDEKSTNTVRVNAFKKVITLYLEPNDGVLVHSSTPVWTVTGNKQNPENLKYTRVSNPFANIGRAYHYPAKRSAVIAYRGENDEMLITGFLNPNVIIRPLPHRLHTILLNEMKNHNDSSINFSEDDKNFRESRHHVVFKNREADIDSKIRIVKREKNNDTMAHQRSKRSIPDIIYPEILVIIDYSLYAVFKGDLKEATRYILALWNAVDLRYRLLDQPRIRLNIAGIIISLTIGGTPYLDNHRRGMRQMDADLALTAMSHYFYKESSTFQFSSYDMAVAITHLDMCNIGHNDICDSSTLGYAYEMGACNRSDIDRNTEAVGIVEDNGGFKAIISAAHEVAHLMGVSHDGFDEATDCPGYKGYIMSSAFNPSENSFSWSECSLKNLHKFFSSAQAACLFNKPGLGVSLSRVLPGKLLTLDEQCERIRGTRACYHNATVCTRLECYVPGSRELCFTKIPAAEGSSCGVGRHCINGHCISKTAIFVPYSIVTTMKPLERANHLKQNDFSHW